VNVDLKVAVNHSREPLTVVGLQGELDVYSAPGLRQETTDLIQSGHHRIVIDLSELRFIDSAGLGALLGVRKRLGSHGGQLAVVCGDGMVRKVFEMTSLSDVLNVVDTLDEAIAAET
jgi:anti-sigma B factor antagonist